MNKLQPRHYIVIGVLFGGLLASIVFVLTSGDDAQQTGSAEATTRPGGQTAQGPSVTRPPATDSAGRSSAQVTVVATTAPTLTPSASAPSQTPSVLPSPDPATVRLNLTTCYDNVSLSSSFLHAFPWDALSEELLNSQSTRITLKTQSGELDATNLSGDGSQAVRYLFEAGYPDGLLLDVYYADSAGSVVSQWMRSRVSIETSIVVEPRTATRSGTPYAPGSCPSQPEPALLVEVVNLGSSPLTLSPAPTATPGSQPITIVAHPQRAIARPDGGISDLHDFELSEPYVGDINFGVGVIGLPTASQDGLQSWELSANRRLVTIVIGKGAPSGVYEIVIGFSDGRSGSTQFQHE